MVAAFVSSGALDEKLVYYTCQEMYFQYAKIQPYLAEFRDKMNLPEFLIGIERLVDQSESGRQRRQVMRRNCQCLPKPASRSLSARNTKCSDNNMRRSHARSADLSYSPSRVCCRIRGSCPTIQNCLPDSSRYWRVAGELHPGLTPYIFESGIHISCDPAATPIRQRRADILG
jgi:hypothetical protein